MCGRFTLTEENAERVAEVLGIPVEQLTPDSYSPRWSIAPSDMHWIDRQKREDREALPAKWVLVQYGSKDAKRAASQINARAELLRGGDERADRQHERQRRSGERHHDRVRRRTSGPRARVTSLEAAPLSHSERDVPGSGLRVGEGSFTARSVALRSRHRHAWDAHDGA